MAQCDVHNADIEEVFHTLKKLSLQTDLKVPLNNMNAMFNWNTSNCGWLQVLLINKRGLLYCCQIKIFPVFEAPHARETMAYSLLFELSQCLCEVKLVLSDKKTVLDQFKPLKAVYSSRSPALSPCKYKTSFWMWWKIIPASRCLHRPICLRKQWMSVCNEKASVFKWTNITV